MPLLGTMGYIQRPACHPEPGAVDLGDEVLCRAEKSVRRRYDAACACPSDMTAHWLKYSNR